MRQRPVTSSPLVVVSSVNKRFGRHRVLSDVSIELVAGSVTVLAGPNGAGKTTLARTIAGFLAPDSGTVLLGGVSPAAYTRGFGFGYMPEDGPRGWPDVTVRELLSWKGDLKRILTDHPYLGGLLAKPTGELSKGQWRLTLLAFALACDPALIILDEPESGLDPAAYDWLTAALRAAAHRGACLVVLTHHLPIIQTEADRVVFIADGAIRLDQPANQLDRAALAELYAATYRSEVHP